MSIRLSLNGKTYRNTGVYAVPVWNECANIKDLALNLNKRESDVTRRLTGGWGAFVGTIKDAAVEFGSVWDTDDDDFQTWRDSYLNGTAVDCMILDSTSSTAGAQGLRAAWEVMQFNRSEQLAEAMGIDISMKPTYSSNAPYWVTT
jgi:hypothetical protein